MSTKIESRSNIAQPGKPRQEATYLQMVWRRFKRHKLAVASLIILCLLYLMAIFAPLLATHDYQAVAPEKKNQAPSSEHWFGTDDVGRDIYSRILHGARISLSVGFVAAGFAVLVGTIVGAVAGYFGGAVDDILMRITEIFMAFPTFFLLITVVSLLPRSIFNIMIVIGLTSWPGLARMVRAEFLSLREQDFSEAARAIGASNRRIIFRHILPNAMAPIIVSTTLRIGGAILTESGLSFLGLGVTEPFPSWGNILNRGRNFIRYAPWITIAPGFFIFITVLCFNFIGDGLRDALDPRLKQ
jgi:peptide/nickel transport system permease protein